MTGSPARCYEISGVGPCRRDVGRIDGEHGDRVDGDEALGLVRNRIDGIHRDVAVGVDGDRPGVGVDCNWYR